MGFAGSIFSGVNSDVDTVNDNPLTGQDYRANMNTGVNNYNQTYQGQLALADQLKALASGQGPNPATSMLAQAQGQNAQQAAGVYANNRSINPALAARQASNLQQQASGQSANQAATLTAQQQIAAQQNLGGLYNQMANQGINLYGTAGGAYNNAAATNAGIASGNQQATTAIQGGLLQGVGAAIGGMGMNQGGIVKGYADGGMATSFGDAGSPGSFAGRYFQSQPFMGPSGGFAALQEGIAKGIGSLGDSTKKKDGGGGGNPMSSMGGMMSGGAGSPIPAEGAGGAAGGGGSIMEMAPMLAMAASKGGKVGGNPSVKGDSPKNDTVPAMLSPGEIVIPRSVVNSSDPAGNAAKFVQAVLAKETMRKGRK